jgi:methylphosphotriester-DNA--protein-cysteine methyltransferase
VLLRPPACGSGETVALASTPKVFAPAGALRRSVVCCWSLDGLDAEPRQDVPDGSVDLLFAFGERVEAAVIGVGTRARTASRPARCVLGATLFPGEALPILDVPLHELRDRIVPLRELWTGTAALLDELAEQPTAEARATVLQRVLALRLERSRVATSPRIRHGLRQLSERGGRLRIGMLARSVGVSERQLQRLFLEQTGLSPKEMARVARLRALLAQLAVDARADWAGLAYDFGFSDQAHLIHEFQALTGKSPQRYLGESDATTRQLDASGFYPVSDFSNPRS